MKVKPLGDKVLVKRLEAEEKTKGGIVLPDSAREKPQRGRIIAAGPGKLLDNGKRGALDVGNGDQVFYGKYSGTEVEMNGETYVVLRESDILAVLTK